MALRDEWRQVKERWLGSGSRLPQPVIKSIAGKGLDFGPSLDKFERAKAGDDRLQALAALTAANDGYTAAIRAAQAAATDLTVKANLTLFLKDLQSFWRKVEALAQPPKPSGRATEIELLYARNLAGGLRPKWLDLGAIDVRAWLVVDSEYEKLVKQGWAEDVHIQLMKAVQKEVDACTQAFKDTILALDAKMTAMSAEERLKKAKEANEVLKHYRDVVERRINQIVDQMWAERLQRKEYLKSFKFGCRVKVVTSALTVAVGTASLALSFGTAALNVIAIAKAIYDAAKAIDKLNRGAEATEKDLRKHLKVICDVLANRRQAETTGAGQTLGKAHEIGKELAKIMLGDAHSLFFKTTSGGMAVAREFYGKLRDLEKQRAEMYKNIVELTNSFPSGTTASPRLNAALQRTHMHFLTLNQRYHNFSERLDQKIEFGQKSIAIIEELQRFDRAAVQANVWGSRLTILIALYSVSNLGTFIGTSKDLLTAAESLRS